MELTVVYGYGESTELISNHSTEQQIKDLMNRLDWSQFTNVLLSIDDVNWISVGGSLGEDGLSIIYSERGEQFVSDIPPDSVEQMTKVLLSYLNQDDQFKKDWKFI